MIIFYVALGGSSTNDAGCGMAAALGYKFLNKNNQEFVPTGGTLNCIKKIIPPKKCVTANVVALCDVNNVLFGKFGAAHVFAKQKGATPKKIKLLDKNLKYFNKLCKKQGFDFAHVAGAGAAGGLGAGAMFFLQATLKSGVHTFFELAQVQQKIDKCDLIISGEGKIDEQSKFGKAVNSLFNICNNKPFVAFCGVNKLKNAPFSIIEINKPKEELQESIMNTAINLEHAVNKFLDDLC